MIHREIPRERESALLGNYILHGWQSVSDQHRMKYSAVALLFSLAATLHARPQTQKCWPPGSCTQNMGQPFGNDFPFGNNGGQPFGNKFPFGNNGGQPFGDKFPFNTSGQGQANQQGVQNCRPGQSCNQNNVGPNSGAQSNGGGSWGYQNGFVGGNTQNCRGSRCNQSNGGHSGWVQNCKGGRCKQQTTMEEPTMEDPTTMEKATME